MSRALLRKSLVSSFDPQDLAHPGSAACAESERMNVQRGLGAAENDQQQDVHHRPADVIDGDDALLLAVHGLREEREGLLDLGLLLRGDVVLLGELGLPRSPARCA